LITINPLPRPMKVRRHGQRKGRLSAGARRDKLAVKMTFLRTEDASGQDLFCYGKRKAVTHPETSGAGSALTSSAPPRNNRTAKNS
jgi:hypothetical protein